MAPLVGLLLLNCKKKNPQKEKNTHRTNELTEKQEWTYVDHNQIGWTYVDHNQIGWTYVDHNQIGWTYVDHNQIG